MKRVPTGCETLDGLLGGGIESGSVTLVFGEGGTGKTNICLQTALNVARTGKKVAYVDTEGLSTERITQIFGEGDILRSLLVFQVHSFDEQTDRVRKVCRLASANEHIGLIVIDSVTMFYRLHKDDTSARNEFIKQTEMLLEAARQNEMAILLTSQVYTNLGTGKIEFLGGHALHHNAKTIIRLDKRASNRRTAVIAKHRSIPEGRSANYRIVDTGIESDSP